MLVTAGLLARSTDAPAGDLVQADKVIE